MTRKKQVTHVIFDMDGLLLDTEGFYTKVQTTILQRFGKDFSWELKAKMMGLKASEAAEVFVAETGLVGQLTPEQFLQEREEMLDSMFPQSQFMPGAERLLRHLKQHDVPFCVATSSHRRHFDLKTMHHRELFGTFDHIVTGDQVASGKPAPDIFQRAAAQFSPAAQPGSCLVFEDAATGVAAAKAADMSVIMVPDPNLDRAATKVADAVLGSLEDFRPEEWGLPAFA